jgi:hypothetical protein
MVEAVPDMVEGSAPYIPPIIKPLTFESLSVSVLNSSSHMNRASCTLLDNHFIPAQAFSTSVADQPPPTPFPTKRRPFRRPLSTDSDEVVEAWFASCGAKIGDACSPELVPKFKRLLYTYRHINAVELEDITPTDLYIHRVRLKEGTKPWRAKHKKKYTPRQQYWLNRIIQEGVQAGMYERTIHGIHGKLSNWAANPNLVEKPRTGPNGPMRLTFDYSYVEEDMPGLYIELLQEVHDYLSWPEHKCYSAFDLKHAYWSLSIYPKDRYYFAFYILGMGQFQLTRMCQGA